MTRRHGERGAAAVEFAIILPVLLLLVMGIAEFGRAYNIQTTISEAAREGVRVMVLQNDVAAAKKTTKAAASTLNLTDDQITVTPGDCRSSTTSAVVATVTVRYRVFFITTLIGTSVPVTGKGVMRCNG